MSNAITTKVAPVAGYEFNLYSPFKQREVGAVVPLLNESGVRVGEAQCEADLATDPKYIDKTTGAYQGRGYYRYRVLPTGSAAPDPEE